MDSAATKRSASTRGQVRSGTPRAEARGWRTGTLGRAAGVVAATAILGSGATARAEAPRPEMTFFVTSAGPGRGADLGGLEGADAHCAKLAAAAGSKRTGWRAYLSTTGTAGDEGVDARSRIGKGPWQNARGIVIARSVEELHSDRNNLTKETALTEKGEGVSGRGDPVNTHDILTGSDPEGRYSTARGDTTCGNWTQSGEGSAIVGHHDRLGRKDTRHMRSWNSSHGTAGCGADAIKSTGGAGLFYCFVAK